MGKNMNGELVFMIRTYLPKDWFKPNVLVQEWDRVLVIWPEIYKRPLKLAWYH